MKKFGNIIFLAVVVCAAFFYRTTLENIWSQAYQRYFPCRSPIVYSVGEFDTRFGISKSDFLSAMLQAESIWEKPAGKQLFKYDSSGLLKVNLIYDNRQASTEELKTMGIVVSNNRASYDSLKEKYDTLISQYNSKKAEFQMELNYFDVAKASYESEVSAANSRGGANKQEFAKLTAEKNALNSQISKLNSDQASLNSMVDEINTLAKALNQLATTLNINVGKFNTVGSSLGGEFDEGLYKSSSEGQEIDIYQFDNREKLVRVLAHELGHALGLDHVSDPKAIMYKLNVGENETPTSADIVELKNLCGLPAQAGIK